MTISYNWISEYIPIKISQEELSKILTSIGLEVESMERYESVRGGLKDLIVGEVMECRQHPGADKLKLTKVNTGSGEWLQIVCGAPNVEKGQKVIVAPVGTTIFPNKGEPVTMKLAKIRGEESFGMICAEDEIGLGESHQGIVILAQDAQPGTLVSTYFSVYYDWIYEIGLTPNRMDAMSHLGVARDVCAYLRHHRKQEIRALIPDVPQIESAGGEGFKVVIENETACKRYTGISISNITVSESPKWLQDKLKSIGQRPINNIVDITNFILHDTGQPLHAFDADKVAGKKIIVKNLAEGTSFLTLDEKEKKLSKEDLMICDGRGNGLCIAGVYGGAESGVKPSTKNIFLESAWFDPLHIRKTSFRHGLRTDAATRFEKNVDISNTLHVLRRAAAMISEIAGGVCSSEALDVYPHPIEKTKITLQLAYLKKLSGKTYSNDAVKGILLALGFEIEKENGEELLLAVPYSKPDVHLQADVIEEIMRIDGYDNIVIPSSITISPSGGATNPVQAKRDKAAGFLIGTGFNEIFTNSITNAAYFEDKELDGTVRLLNNLSAVHNIMRPSMLQTGLECIAYNLNRKNSDLRFFEIGKTYHQLGIGKYSEEEHLCIYVSGSRKPATWKGKNELADVFYLKGITEAILHLLGVPEVKWETENVAKLKGALVFKVNGELIASLGTVAKTNLQGFDIKQEVYFADIRWRALVAKTLQEPIYFRALPNQQPVNRDLAIVVPQNLPYQSVESAIDRMNIGKLQSVKLFDVFTSEKLGSEKKSMAVSFTFLDEEKTLTDKEVDSMMNKIMLTLEQELSAEIRKGV